MVSVKALKKIKIFEMLPDAVLMELAGVLSEEKFRKEECIIRRNEPGKCMYFLLSGEVRIRVPDKPDSLIEEGNFFGEMALISGAPRAADVVADTDVRLLILTKQQFETELSSRPLFSRLLTQVFADRLGSPAAELTDKNLGKYRIHNEIGRGAMGVIYYGTHMSLEMPVAVKMLSHRFVFDTASLRKFLNEAKIIAGLNHRNIRSVIDIEQAYGTYFIIMEYIEGVSLDKLLGSRKNLTYPLYREIIYQVADGLAHAHARGVVHRDIKPGNILINNQGDIKITDFGIAYADKENLQSTESLSLGTPYYAAPEQIRGEAVDYQADIYSFGVLCYNILTGKMPFDGSDPLTVFSRHLNDDYIPPAELVPDLPQDLAVLIKRCLEKEKKRRLHSLNNLRELTQVWAFGEEFEDPVHQAIGDLEMINYHLPTQELLVRRIRQIRQADQAAAPEPEPVAVQSVKPDGRVFTLESDKNEDNALFEFNLESTGEEMAKSPGAESFSDLLKIQEKRRQEQVIIGSLLPVLLTLRTPADFYKMLTAFFCDLLKESACSLLIPGSTGEIAAGSYYFKSSQYRLAAGTEQELLAGFSPGTAVLTREAGGEYITALLLTAGDTRLGVFIFCNEKAPGKYSGTDFFRDLCAIFRLLRI